MVVPKINSAHGSDTRNIINRNIDVTNAIGKAVQELVAKGQLTPTQYATLIQTINGLIKKGELSVDDININLGRVGLRHLDEEVKSAITGDTPILSEVADNVVTNAKLAEGAVDASKTDFIEMGKNLFDKSRVINNTGLDNQGKIISNPDTSTTDYLIPVTPNTSYYKNKDGNVAIYDSNMQVVQWLPFSTVGAFTTPAKSAYMRLSVRNYNIEDFQVEKGTSGTSYEAYYRKMNPDYIEVGKGQIKNDSVTIEMLSGMVRSRNLFNQNDLANGYIDRRNGEFIEQFENRATNYYIEVESGVTYTVQPMVITGAINMAFYNKDKVYISGHQITAASTHGRVTAPTNATYLKFSVPASIVGETQFEKGSTPTPYENYYYYFPEMVFPSRTTSSNGLTKGNYAEVTSAYDVRFYTPITDDLFSTYRFSNADTGDDFMKGRENGIYRKSGNAFSHLFDLTHDTSNKEFALEIDDGSGTTSWFPEHNKTATAFEGVNGFRKLYLDGNEVNLSDTNSLMSFERATLVQVMECKTPNDSTVRAVIKFTVTIENGECKETVRIDWKKQTLIPNGYIFMSPMNTTTFVDNLMSADAELFKSKPDNIASDNSYLNNEASTKFFFTSDKPNKTDVVFITELLHATIPAKSIFFQHRNGTNEKLYIRQYENTTKNIGDVDYFEGVYKIKHVPKANNIYGS